MSSTGKLQPTFAPVLPILCSLNPAGSGSHSHHLEVSFIKIKNLIQSIGFFVKKKKLKFNIKENVFIVSSSLPDSRVENIVVLEGTKPATICIKARPFCQCSTFLLRSSYYAGHHLLCWELTYLISSKFHNHTRDIGSYPHFTDYKSEAHEGNISSGHKMC